MNGSLYRQPASLASRTLWLLVLAASLAARVPAVAQTAPEDDGPPLARLETRHYVLYSDLSERHLREADLRMTALSREYARRMARFGGRSVHKLPFHLYASQERYRDLGGIEGSVGLYDGLRLVAWMRPGEELSLWHTVQHEAFHQYADVSLGRNLPIFFTEGLADYFGEAMFVVDGYQVGLVPNWRLERLKPKLTTGLFNVLVMMSHEEWNADLDPARYDYAWSLVHYLVHGGDDLHRAFLTFLRLVDAGHRPIDAYGRAFGAAFELEKSWRKYWGEMPAHPTAGLYAEGCARILAHALGRAELLGERPADLTELLAMGDLLDGQAKPAQWLPASLLEVARIELQELETIGWVFQVDPGTDGGLPRLEIAAPDGNRYVASFTLRGGRVQSVSIEPIRMRPAVLQEQAAQ